VPTYYNASVVVVNSEFVGLAPGYSVVAANTTKKNYFNFFQGHLKICMPRVTSLLRPAAKPDPEKPKNPVRCQPVKLEPSGKLDEMDFSKICSRANDFDDDDVPDLEAIE
jgi:hypothetical protein